jgi:hypothetical protein
VLRVEDVQARVQRLDELGRGLAKEVVLVRKGEDPLLYLERRAYLNAFQDATAGVEAARVVLARACQRIDGSGGTRQAERQEGAAQVGWRASAGSSTWPAARLWCASRARHLPTPWCRVGS